MATVVSCLPRPRALVVKHSVERYLDGQVWRLVRGEDYTTASALRATLYRLASSTSTLQVTVQVRRNEDGVREVAYVQARPRQKTDQP